jgi:hypothetical protein
MIERQDNPKARAHRPAIALLAAAPYLGLQLIFLLDIQGWSEALGYGLFFILFPAVFAGWIVLFVVELVKRRHLPAGRYRLPAFSLCGICFLLMFFHVGVWLRPVVLSVPSWCRVNQKIEWSTQKPNEKYGGKNSYILMLVGRGNEAHHSFTSAYLNWTGDQPAGLPNISFTDRTFGHWEGYDLITYPASLQALRDRLRSSELPQERVDAISSEIWQIIQQVGSNKRPSVSDGQVDPIWTGPFGDEDVVLGGITWMLLLLGVFQVIGILTLPRNKQDGAEQSHAEATSKSAAFQATASEASDA